MTGHLLLVHRSQTLEYRDFAAAAFRLLTFDRHTSSIEASMNALAYHKQARIQALFKPNTIDVAAELTELPMSVGS